MPCTLRCGLMGLDPKALPWMRSDPAANLHSGRAWFVNGNVDSTDVVVWGGGTGGVAAAIQASRSGARTLLLTPGTWLGGMVSAAGCVAPMATNSLHGKPVSGERFSENWNRPNPVVSITTG